MDCEVKKLERSANELIMWRQHYVGIRALAVYRDDPETALEADSIIDNIEQELDRRKQ